jgi:hypothetical protein
LKGIVNLQWRFAQFGGVDWSRKIVRVNPSWDRDRAGEEEENSNPSRDLGVKFGGGESDTGVSTGVY